MMTSNERGTFMTEDKKSELKALNEGIFSNIGADIASISNTLTKKMKTITTKAGKAVENAINKLDIAGFKKSMGVKSIDDIDEKLSLMAVNDPEFYAIMHKLMLATIKAKKTNKELYEALTPIYDNHIERMVEYYETLLRHSTDDTQSEMYFLLLHDIIPWLDRERNKALISKIRNTTSSFLDRKATRELTKSSRITTGANKELLDNVKKLDYKFKKNLEDFDRYDLKALSNKEKDIYRQWMKVIEDESNQQHTSPDEARRSIEKKAIQPAAPVSKQENLQAIDKVEKKLGKDMTQINEADLQRLSNDEREAYIQAADNFLEEYEKGEWQNKIDPKTGMLGADLDAVGAAMTVAKTLAAAIKLRGKTVKSPKAPDQSAIKQPAPGTPEEKPNATIKPNPITANKPAAPIATAKQNPITAGKKL
jgi:uncharacterized protein YfkK (UPF0435 family)